MSYAAVSEEVIVGRAKAITLLRREIEQIAPSEAKVLITGPTGAGKELVARQIHRLSHRRNGPMVTVNCAALTESILESELFGHMKGSFTGTIGNAPGKIQVADGGTLFLDEIGDMSLRMQGLILRFLESGEIQPVGSSQTKEVDVRVITATNADLVAMVKERTFRKDLYYRLNVVNIRVPPLVAHTDDIPDLLEHFVSIIGGPSRLDFAPEVIDILTKYSWPGNVRELRNTVENILARTHNGTVTLESLPAGFKEPAELSEYEREAFGHKTTVDELYEKITEGGESFWNIVYPMYMKRDLNKGQVRQILDRGLSTCGGNYRMLTRIFNMEENEYKVFTNFLRKQGLQLDFKKYRQIRPVDPIGSRSSRRGVEA